MDRMTASTGTTPVAGYLSAGEAAEALGVSIATLYAYVSRGLVRSEEAPGATRARRYRGEDIAELVRRKELRRKPEEAAAGALTWGMPVLESAITLIDAGSLYYRGYDALRLAQECSIEQVARLLWGGVLDDASAFTFNGPSLPDEQLPGEWLGGIDAITELQARLPLLAAADPSAYDLTPETLERVGCRIIRRFTELVARASWSDEGLVATLQQGWRLPENDAADLLNAALVLSADHELNVSTFTVRCVASAGAPLYTASAAGLAAMQGSRHGGATLRIEALLAEVGSPAETGAVLRRRLRRGDAVPGIGHTLYPQGDPRGALLLALLRQHRPGHPAVARALALSDAAAELTGKRPTHDYALVALCQAFDLPPSTALQLFALGRCIGWIAHANEEYGRGRLIRPRARYTGPAPLANG